MAEEEQGGAVQDALYVTATDQTKEGLLTFNIQGTAVQAELVKKLKDFEALRAKMVERWPGIYIPNVPSKRLVGANDEETSQIRVDLLNRFCFEIINTEYLLKGKELEVFLMSSNDTAKSLNTIPNQDIEELVKKYSLTFTEFDENYDTQELKTMQGKFGGCLKEVYSKVKSYRDLIKGLKDKYESNKEDLPKFIASIMLFEKEVINEYSDKDLSKSIFFNSGNTELNNNIANVDDKMENPYIKLYENVLWDILEIEAMMDCYNSNKNLQDHYDKLVKSYYNCNSTLTDFMAGKKTTLFGFKKKEDRIKELTEEKERLEKEMSNLGQVIKITTFNLDKEIAIFKRKFVDNYYEELNLLQEKIINNSDHLCQLWTTVLNDQNLNQA